MGAGASSVQDGSGAGKPHPLDQIEQHMDGVRQFADHAQVIAHHAHGAYQLLQKHLQRQGVTAKEGGYFGGDETEAPLATVHAYGESLSAKTKREMMRRLARVFNGLFSASINADGSSEEIAAKIREVVSPKLKIREGNEGKVCLEIAKALNSEFSQGSAAPLFDVPEDAADRTRMVGLCVQINDYINSLIMGLQGEFLEVHGALRRALQNQETLDAMMAEMYKRILEGCEKRKEGTAHYEEAYKRLREEHDRQMNLVKQLLDVTVTPVQQDVQRLLDKNSELYKLMDRQKMTEQGGEFGKAIVGALTGLGTAAAVAAKVNAALKEVGISMDKYRSATSWREFDQLLDEKRGSVDKENFVKFEKAAAELRNMFGRREEIRGGEEKKTDMDRRVEARKEERKVIFRTYLEKVTTSYNEFLRILEGLGKKLGKEIPVTDSLVTLKDAISELESQSGVAANLALIGFYSSVDARQRRDLFLSRLRRVRSAAEELAQQQEYSRSAGEFTALAGSVSSILRTIDYYSDMVVKKYGGEEEVADSLTPAEHGDDSDDDEASHLQEQVLHDEEEVYGGADLTPEEMGLEQAARARFDLKTAVNVFNYYFFVAQVRRNLSQTKDELRVYGEKYDKVVGDAIAGRINALTKDKAEAVKALGDRPNDAEDQKNFDAAKSALDTQFDVKRKFWRALEALDLYLQAFTEGIVTNPDDIRALKKSLDGVTVIAKWFDDNTGNELAKFFDMFPDANGADAAVLDAAGETYYEKVVTVGADGVGRVDRAAKATKASELEQQMGKVLSNFMALKNIIAPFEELGRRFGGKDLNRASFMTPTQIYRSLVDFLRVSAVSVGPTPALPAAPGAAVAPQVYVTPASDKAPVRVGKTNWDCESMFFAYMIKAIAAKILTVIGVYNLFDRPEPVTQLTPVRMIIGGDLYGAEPEIIDRATELYFRLPRLVEFYRDLFKYNAAGAAVQITMIPEMEGVFSGLIQLMFLQVSSASLEVGSYSDSETKALIREINAIYTYFQERHGDKACREALLAFVMEINRRYGLVKKAEYEKYMSLMRERANLADGNYNPQTLDYAILPGELEQEATGKLAPSDRYLQPGAAEGVGIDARPGLYDIDCSDSQWEMLKDFRQKLDDLFNQPGVRTNIGKVSFNGVVRQARLEISRSASTQDKFTIAARLIQGSTSLSGADVDRAFVLHETVVVGLNTLYAMQQTIEEVSKTVKAINDVVDPAAAAAAAGVVPPDDAAKRVQMEKYIKLLFRLVGDFQDLVQIRFPNAPAVKIQVSFSGLQNLIEGLMDNVRQYISMFRGSMPKEFLDKLEDKGQTGSLYWLEENLVDTYLRQKSTLGGIPTGDVQTLDKTSSMLNNILVKLLEAPPGAPGTSYGNVFAGLAFYDVGQANSGVALQTALLSGSPLAELTKGNRLPPPANANDSLKAADDDAEINAYLPLYTDTKGLKTAAGAGSIMFLFNQLVALFLETFYDKASGKIYTGLINSFAQGSFSQSVMGTGYSHPDLTSNGPQPFGLRGDPTGKAILVDSLSTVLRRLTLDTVNNQSLHLVSTLTEIPLFIKESYRANLPIFQRLFETLGRQATLLKQLCERTNVNLARVGIPAGVAANLVISGGAGDANADTADSNVYHAKFVPNATLYPIAGSGDRATTKAHVIGVLDGVTSGTFTLSSSATDVLRELADEPVYLETGENSIQEYKTRYGKLPLMPLSLSLGYLANKFSVLPTSAVSDESFQMAYGTRGILMAPKGQATLATMPGQAAILEGYNAMADTREKMNPEQFADFTRRTVAALRFMMSYWNFGRALSGDEAVLQFAPGLPAAPGAPQQVLAYPLRPETTAVNVLEVVSSSYQQEKVNEITRGLKIAGVQGLGGDRSLERILSIIDLNIMPVNVHALQRGLALAPTYNYSYTFEQMASLMLGKTVKEIETVVENLKADDAGTLSPLTTRDVFLALLLKPYAEVSDNAYGRDGYARGTIGQVARIFRGSGDLGMGRLKFLSDQLFGKVLFGSLYPSQAAYDQAGPGVAGVMQASISGYRGNADANRVPDDGAPGVPLRLTQMQKPDPDTEPWTRVQELAGLGVGQVRALAEVGKARFDTLVVRNLYYITCVQQILRVRMNRELVYYNQVLAQGHSVVNPAITEYGQDGALPYEQAGDRQYLSSQGWSS